MQFHLNGFRPGDPAIAEPQEATTSQDVDVLIVGCGPAGLTLAAQLSAFPEISVRITERKPGPLEVGQADGIACRSVEMFEAFGFAEKVMKEGYWVNEVSFWRPGTTGALHRADRIQDVEDDLSEMPHVILNQARVHDFYLEIMRNSPRRLTPDYNRELVELTETGDADHPMQATFKCLDGTGTETIRARYVVGCDGARSTVRASMGHALKGESARQLWGVMDVLPVTDFPDIRLKAAIQSADEGSVLIIPREGGYMVRMYIELDELHGEERAADRDVSAEMLIAKAQAILAPYTLKVQEVAWWSAYEIGQRVCDAFDDVPEAMRGSRSPRIFIAGDACHTHSPKAGQGMNVSMADTFNLGWKLAAVLRGRAAPALLDTYSEERRAKAKELIDFDRDMARLFSAKPKDAAEAEQFQRYFKQHGRYTAGVETRYDPSLITGGTEHQALAAGQLVGKRFHSAPVVRLADAKPVQLGHAFKADGRWPVLAFAPTGDAGQAGGAVAQLCAALAPVIAGFTPKGADPDSVIDLRAVFQFPHREMRLEDLPGALLPQKGKYGLTDYEKVFCPAQNGPDIFDLRGIDRARGALLILRPDQYVAQVLPLDAAEEISHFFKGFLLRA
ncbi:FAD-dependent monooxygenase [Alloyangia pacifica]|uniref:FAD-dependent monooxygenase n=1 Tax=Alloyangia pacifica TaxID=311180 RepID=UPI001CD5F863|nr:FAD-dependent monooxygenase [Alloyangia pacifica]MCA0995914.1 FAD-dependent monooxygenase [Alloyangia pacifica]